MTDNRTAELRKLLDERGIEWKDEDSAYEIKWSTPDGRHCSAMYWKPTFTVLVSGCTPEQAIAATLGSEREAKLIRAMEDVLRHATDTVWVGEVETLVDRMVSLGVYGCEVYEGEATEGR